MTKPFEVGFGPLKVRYEHPVTPGEVWKFTYTHDGETRVRIVLADVVYDEGDVSGWDLAGVGNPGGYRRFKNFRVEDAVKLADAGWETPCDS